MGWWVREILQLNHQLFQQTGQIVGTECPVAGAGCRMEDLCSQLPN